LKALASYQTVPSPHTRSFAQRWFSTGIAISMLLVVICAFTPSLSHPAGRRAPLAWLAAMHGTVFFVWLLIFLMQCSLVASRHVVWHRRLGLAAIVPFALMIPLAWLTTIAMIRRGYDLSGDLRVQAGSNIFRDAVFPLCNILIFAALVSAALAYRRRPAVHQRLMLFANIELMPAPLAHLIGHSPALSHLPGIIIMVPVTLFVLAAVARDVLVNRRVHPLTWWLAALRMVSGPLEAGPIGSSVVWQHFAAWLAR
jgi:hypothetical protein